MFKVNEWYFLTHLVGAKKIVCRLHWTGPHTDAVSFGGFFNRFPKYFIFLFYEWGDHKVLLQLNYHPIGPKKRKKIWISTLTPSKSFMDRVDVTYYSMFGLHRKIYSCIMHMLHPWQAQFLYGYSDYSWGKEDNRPKNNNNKRSLTKDVK